MNEEGHMRVESVRIPGYRATPGSCRDLAKSIDSDGLRHPITVWSDGTLVSGERRLRAHILLGRDSIPAMFVSTIEDAAKRLLADNQDDHLARPMLPSDMCRLWSRMRILDEPAAIQRSAESRRRGVHLRREVLSGARKPGRAPGGGSGEEYLITVMSEPFGLSAATAARTDRIYRTGYTDAFDASDADRELARALMKDLDDGATSVWSAYQVLLGHEKVARPKKGSTAKITSPTVSVSSSKQLTALDKALPLMEGAMQGLTALGAIHKDLTWEQVGPYHARLRRIRRDMEKMINQMREFSQK